jgi:cholesterol oxidase
MDRLAKPLCDIQASYDAVVIGSGYGGGIAASRLARMGYKTALLERGDEMHPGEYPDTPEKAAEQSQVHLEDCTLGAARGLFDLRLGKDMNVLVGCGLGGTSLINANVSIEPDPRVFDDPAWPSGFHDQDLQDGYSRARAMLRPEPYPDPSDGWPALNKLIAMKQSAEAIGAVLTKPPINVTFKDGPNAAGVSQPPCNLCGDCCSGCNVGAKNTVLMNYLPDACANGAEIFCGATVAHVSSGGEARWTVHYQPTGFDREDFAGEPLTVEADIVVISAGTLGSTEILLRSRAKGLPISNAIGTRFSGNGDVLAFAYNCDQPVDGIGMGWRAAGYDWHDDPLRPVGPTITGLIDLRGTDKLEDGMIIEEGAIPGGLGKFLPSVMAVAAHIHGTDTDPGDLVSEAARELESLTRGPYRGAVNHTQTFLIMSQDGADGRLALNDHGRLELSWPGVGDKPDFKKVSEKICDAAAALGGTYVPNPIWSDLLRHELITVHPLGGCPIAADAATGVVDQGCKVFASANGAEVHEGLYVCDGSVMPRCLGVNPLLTISAVTERAMIRLARERGRTISVDPAVLQTSATPAGEQPIGIRFTEKMAGSVRHTDGEDHPASFLLTIVADDLDRLVDDKSHEAEIVGTINIAPLSPDAITVRDGSWNLFIDDPNRPDTKLMTYRMPFEVGARRYLALGEKTIHDDRGFDLWKDTTTLALTVHDGPDESAPVVCRGTLTIEPADFIRQMRTMTVVHAKDLDSRMKALAKFGRFFGGVLFQTYGGPFAVPKLFDPDAVRLKRPLRAGIPDVRHFVTHDGKTLRFTRYRGGDKGPLILSHGLGVSSLIFSIETIDTNLLEYLYAAGYDCWLLDYRASIELPYATEQFSADDVAKYDYPAAVAHVRSATGAESVQMVAHCYGAMSFAMAMLTGLEGVRSAVISQIAAHADVPMWPQRFLAYLHAPAMMALAGAKSLDARATTKRNAISKLLDMVLGFYPYHSEDRTLSATSRRITALYGPLYEITQLNPATMDALPEMFGKANIKAFRQLSKIARRAHVVRASSRDPYITDANLRNFAIPTLFIHGELNRTFLPSGTRRTMDALSRANGAELYERCVIAGTGHIDSIFGRNAARDVYPKIVEHLDRTARI